MALYTTNLVPLKSNGPQPNQDDIRSMSALGLTLAAKDKNAIYKKVFRFGQRLSNKDAFTICITAEALGIPLFKLNSFCDIKF